MEELCAFDGHWAYFTAVWYILSPFCQFNGPLVHFPCFGILYQEKSGNPAPTMSRHLVDKLKSAANTTQAAFTTTTLPLNVVN
jgi:hypothetical protein